MRYEELGLDRRHNRYWQFACGQPGSARIFIELQVLLCPFIALFMEESVCNVADASCTA